MLNNATPATPSDPEQMSQEDKPDEGKIAAAIAKLPKADQVIAIAQGYCVVLEENRLGSMGTPVKVMIEGRPVFLCCEGCKKKALADGKAILSKAGRLKENAAKH